MTDDLAKHTMHQWLEGKFTVEELGPDDFAVGEPRKDILYDVPIEFMELIWEAAFERGRAQAHEYFGVANH